MLKKKKHHHPRRRLSACRQPTRVKEVTSNRLTTIALSPSSRAGMRRAACQAAASALSPAMHGQVRDGADAKKTPCRQTFRPAALHFARAFSKQVLSSRSDCCCKSCRCFRRLCRTRAANVPKHSQASVSVVARMCGRRSEL